MEFNRAIPTLKSTRLWLALATILTVGCGSATEQPIEIAFNAVVNGAPVSCSSVYANVGTSSTEMAFFDVRLYVHDVRVVTSSGEEIAVSLEQDGQWQMDNIALLDFEDGTGECSSGTASTHTVIRGTVAGGEDITGLRFRIGVPSGANHDDASTAAAPLNLTSMFWSWNAGYKFIRVDGRTTGQSGFRVHLGSTECEGDGRGNVTGCNHANRPEIELTNFNPASARVRMDLGALFANSNMDMDEGGAPGCMSAESDPDCLPMFHALGLTHNGVAPSGPQTVFTVDTDL